MKDYFLRSERSYVDISTNFANIASIDLDFESEDFLKGDIHLRHLLTLIHEVTHHWSLTSYVGTALSAHLLRSHVLGSKAVAGLQLSLKEQQDMERSVITGKLCHAVLAPLFEGLALYAEWRATPTDDVVYSRPFAIVPNLVGGTEHFSSEEENEIRRMAESLQNADSREYQRIITEFGKKISSKGNLKARSFNFAAYLQYIRANSLFIGRKVSLFEKSIEPAIDPYQIGYTFICGLELSCKESVNTERFLAFLKDYFLNDIELARIISQDLEGPELYSRLRERLQFRVSKFYTKSRDILNMVGKWDEDQGFIREIGGGLDEKFGTSGHLYHSCDLSQELYYEQIKAYYDELYELLDLDPSFIDLSRADLIDFLFAGRLAMPFRVRQAKVGMITDDYVQLITVGGAEFRIKKERMPDSILTGEEILIVLMAGVSSGDVGICIFSSNSHEIILRRIDESRNDFWNLALKNYTKLIWLSRTGSEALEKVRIGDREADTTGERLDAGVMKLLTSAAFYKDLEQIYRMPIVMAFSASDDYCRDASWREREFERWKKNGISSIFENPSDLIDFTRCSMVTTLVSIDLSGQPDIELSEDEAIDAFIQSIYGFSKNEYLKIIKRLEKVALSKGVKLFSEDVRGFKFPYL